jgi:glycosyltransferase involved in cell wall biosynthesis
MARANRPVTASRPRILYFSRSVPPGASGSAVITGNLMRQFDLDDMLVMGAWFVGSPPARRQAGGPRVVYATLHPPDSWRGGRAIRWAQFPWLLLRALWAALAGRYDVILATYPDEIYLLTAYCVSLLTGCPLYLYFHNTYLEHDRGNLFAPWLQPRVFARARHVFVMSQGMQVLYQRYYPDLVCTPLVHTFNELLPTLDDVEPGAEPHVPLRIALSGSVNESNSGAVRHMAQAMAALPDAHMLVYTRTNPGYLAALGVQGARYTIATLSREQLLNELRTADIFFLPHGFSEKETIEEVQTIFPTRTIEYLISGRPILAHLPEDCFLADFLREHECALLVTEPDAEALAQAVHRLQSDAALRVRLVQNALKAAEQFHAPVVARRLREALRPTDVEYSPGLS